MSTNLHTSILVYSCEAGDQIRNASRYILIFHQLTITKELIRFFLISGLNDIRISYVHKTTRTTAEQKNKKPINTLINTVEFDLNGKTDSLYKRLFTKTKSINQIPGFQY